MLHDFILTYYSSIILGSFSIILFPKLCWHIGITPNCIYVTRAITVFTIQWHYYSYLPFVFLLFIISLCPENQFLLNSLSSNDGFQSHCFMYLYFNSLVQCSHLVKPSMCHKIRQLNWVSN